MTLLDKKKRVPKTKKVRREWSSERKANRWLVFVKAFAVEHPDLKYKDVLSGARPTYVRVAPKQGRVPGAEKKPNAWMQHVANYKNEHPYWKQAHTYKDVLKLCKATHKAVV